MIQRYVGKISGPLLDRIDIHIEVPPVKYRELRSEAPERMLGGDPRRRRGRARRSSCSAAIANARMPSKMIREHCRLDEAGESTLEMAVQRMGLSARAHDRILKVARTIADSRRRGERSGPAPRRSGAIPQPGPDLLELKTGKRPAHFARLVSSPRSVIQPRQCQSSRCLGPGAEMATR